MIDAFVFFCISYFFCFLYGKNYVFCCISYIFPSNFFHLTCSRKRFFCCSLNLKCFACSTSLLVQCNIVILLIQCFYNVLILDSIYEGKLQPIYRVVQKKSIHNSNLILSPTKQDVIFKFDIGSHLHVGLK